MVEGFAVVNFSAVIRDLRLSAFIEIKAKHAKINKSNTINKQNQK